MILLMVGLGILAILFAFTMQFCHVRSGIEKRWWDLRDELTLVFLAGLICFSYGVIGP